MIEEQDYLRMLEEGFEHTRQSLGDATRLQYIGEHIFGFVTYEQEYDELFAKKALMVCEAVNLHATYAFIKTPENRLWYLLMMNMPFFQDRVVWGSSIRGAWWDTSIAYTSCGLWLDGNQYYEELTFTSEQWHAFIAALLEFSRKEEKQ
jgi:hypothetical protein